MGNVEETIGFTRISSKRRIRVMTDSFSSKERDAKVNSTSVDSINSKNAEEKMLDVPTEQNATLAGNQTLSCTENNINREIQQNPLLLSPKRISEKELQEQLYDPVFSHTSTQRKNL